MPGSFRAVLISAQTYRRSDEVEAFKKKVGRTVLCVGIAMPVLTGCAHLEFDGDGKVHYYDPVPYLFVATTKECVTTATVVALPGQERRVGFKSGFGSSDLSVGLTNGMLTSVGQKSDSKVPEVITALGTAAAATMVPKAGCTATAVLYPVTDGKPDLTHPLAFAVP